MVSPFEVLGIDPDASDEDVVEAYRERVKEAHPDQGGSASEFQLVRTAYEQIQAGSDDDIDPERDDLQEQEHSDLTQSRVEYLNYTVIADHGWDLGDEDLFEKAAAAGLDLEDHGEFRVHPDDSLLEAAEKRGLAWPFACRGGACTNCAVMVVEGEMPTPNWQILPPDLIDRGIRLSCNTAPTTDEAKVLYNVKHLPGVDELRLPPSRFEKAHSDD